MDEELARLYSRWRAADETDRDEEADAAFRALSEALLPERAVPLEFTARTTDAIAHAMAADARRASRSPTERASRRLDAPGRIPSLRAGR